MTGVELLHYRPWRGSFHKSVVSVWPIARIALLMMFRRKLFWGLYALGLLFFLMFFFGQYLFAWAGTQLAESSISVMGIRAKPEELVYRLQRGLQLDGSAATYTNFFRYQGHMLIIVLALAGALLVGNDIQHGSLSFYLSKSLSRWHYLLGKCLAVAVFVNLLTTLPAICAIRAIWAAYFVGLFL